jgi:hypothetical protein
LLQINYFFVAARKNTPPVAVIKPVNQEVKLPNSAILDGSGGSIIKIDIIKHT